MDPKRGPRVLLGFWDSVCSGDLSCPPKGALKLSSVGRLIGPNGEISRVFSHDPRVGGFGGFEGFQGTDVVLMPEFRIPKGLSPGLDLGKSESEDDEGLAWIGSRVLVSV